MHWFNKLVGGFLGFLLGGFLGAILGALIGHIFDKHFYQTTSDSQNASKTQFNLYHNHYAINSEIQQAYRLLGITSSASKTEIKQAYRRYIGRYHPDRLAQQKLSSQLLIKSNQKAQSIKQAYEIICKEKNIC